MSFFARRSITKMSSSEWRLVPGVMSIARDNACAAGSGWQSDCYGGVRWVEFFEVLRDVSGSPRLLQIFASGPEASREWWKERDEEGLRWGICTADPPKKPRKYAMGYSGSCISVR